MKWEKRNPTTHSISDVIFSNTGIVIEEMEEEKKYSISKMPIAASLIKSAIRNNTKVCVVADYDADGITSAAIMRLTLDALGGDSYIRIPRRMSEGYGLNPVIVDELPKGALLICVDNGIVAFDAIEKAKEKGMTVVILDHHFASEDGRLPCADVVIDPAAIGEADFTGYCGAGLAYKLAVELLGETHPTVVKCLSFAAIATVADVMALIGENRIIVKNGLEAMMTEEGRTKGLEALIKLNGLEVAIDEKNLGFKIAPCLNAPGRLYDDGATKSYELLVCDTTHEDAEDLAREILADNELRKKKKDDGVIVLEKNILDNNLSNDVPLILYEPGLDEGIVGLYAGHFAEEMRRPCIVFTDSKESGFIKGSARSFGDVHLKNVLDENSEWLHKYGGHKGAAGLTIRKDNLENLRNGMKNSLSDFVVSDVKYYDLETTADNVPNLISELARYAPFGEGNPEVVFKVTDFQVSPTTKGFVQTMCDGKHGKVVNKEGVTAIAFGLGEKLEEEVGEKPKLLNLFGRLSMNVSKFGSVPQVEVEDFMVQTKTVPTTILASRLKRAAKK